MGELRATGIARQRDCFGMIEESLESLFAYTPGINVVSPS